MRINKISKLPFCGQHLALFIRFYWVDMHIFWVLLIFTRSNFWVHYFCQVKCNLFKAEIIVNIFFVIFFPPTLFSLLLFLLQMHSIRDEFGWNPMGKPTEFNWKSAHQFGSTVFYKISSIDNDLLGVFNMHLSIWCCSRWRC